MSTTQRVLTPTSVGRFVASMRSVAASSDGLALCSDCRRYMSDMATSCPHCGAETVAATAPATGAAPVRVRTATSDVRAMSVIVLCLALGAYVISRIAGL